MQKKVHYIRAIHFISLFHTLEGIRNSKKKKQNPENWSYDYF